VGIEYDQLVHASHAVKEDVYREVVRILEEVIKFKLHVQSGLENLQEELDGVTKEAMEETVM
jgi:kinetochore protein NDC80